MFGERLVFCIMQKCHSASFIIFTTARFEISKIELLAMIIISFLGTLALCCWDFILGLMTLASRSCFASDLYVLIIRELRYFSPSFVQSIHTVLFRKILYSISHQIAIICYLYLWHVIFSHSNKCEILFSFFFLQNKRKLDGCL